jgi:hypothetical protein
MRTDENSGACRDDAVDQNADGVPILPQEKKEDNLNQPFSDENHANEEYEKDDTK